MGDVGTADGTLGVDDVAAAAANAVGVDDGWRTVSTAWTTPFVASIFRDWIDAPFTFRPFASENVSSPPVNEFLVGDPLRWAAISLPETM